MACYHPVQFWYCNKEIYGRSTTYNRKHAIQPDDPKFHPCGGCVGCRLEKSRSWAVRCTHEASLYSSNCFLTLTYSPENLPKYGTLVPKHFTDFLNAFGIIVEVLMKLSIYVVMVLVSLITL